MNVNDHENVAKWCKENAIDMVVVGPEDPLSRGISDNLTKAGIPTFGPSKAAARIESDKAFAKDFMAKYEIPTAAYGNFTDAQKAKDFIEKSGCLVVKASGLAAGKGVIVAKNKQEAIEAIDDIMIKRIFGDAGNEVVVEEFLEGDEVSFFALTDGQDFQMLLPAQDHKRAYVNDEGPNTGGMGAFCPYPFMEDSDREFIKKNVFEKTIQGMRKEGHPFAGLLYAGLMMTPNGPKIIEFNCRFGDPETQSVLALLNSDLSVALEACINGTIGSCPLEWQKNKTAVGVVVASGGYPGTVQKNIEITGLDKVKEAGLLCFHAGSKYENGKILTNGGRVLTVVAVDDTLEGAAKKAISGAGLVKIDKSFYRNDIAFKSIARLKSRLDYKASGVDIDAGNALVEHIKVHAKKTVRSGVMEQIGGFGSLFDLKCTGMKDPILVSGTDGVGTKLKIAIDTGKLDTVGIDLVAMCVNDILVQGAEPLFFLDYFATSKLEVEKAADVVKGIAKGCEYGASALIGGETAEMPGMYAPGDFDLAGFSVGAVERDQMLPRKNEIHPNDVILGLSSSGVHSNGFSLVRKILAVNDLGFEDPCPFKPGKTFADVLLEPTRIYVRSLLPVIKTGKVKALCHITGGGLLENIPRVLNQDSGVDIDADKYPVPQIFTWLKSAGGVSDKEMLRTFNCGIGMILVVSQENQWDVQHMLEKSGEKCFHIGTIKKREEGQEEQVIVHNFSKAVAKNPEAVHKRQIKSVNKKKVAVLISGSGTNLKAIIDYVKNNFAKTSIDLSLVISNKPEVGGLKIAEDNAIQTVVIPFVKGTSREDYDAKIHKVLLEHNIEFVCLAGFMRILSGEFVDKWTGRMVNIHPSLLPSFKGAHAYEQALEAGVCFTGCTVHFVVPEMDAGPIIAQDIIRIETNDTAHELAERGKSVEHKLYPRALESVVSGRVTMQNNKAVFN